MDFRSEAASRRTWQASGADYALELVQGAGHCFDHIDAGMMRAEGMTVGRKAVAFFALAPGG